MNNRPLISIIIPTFNRERCVDKAVKSIITALPHEIIVIDDGSQDGTEHLVLGLSLQNLHFIKHKVNQGAAAARNTGIKSAKGRYIAFLDSDDTWLPYKLDKQLDFLMSHPQFRACYTDFFYNKIWGRTEIRCPTQENYEDFLLGCFIAPGTTLLIEKEIFNEIGYYSTELKRFEDWDFLLRFSYKFPMGNLNVPLAIVNQSSAPSSQDVIQSADFLENKFQKNVKEKLGKKGIKTFLNALGREKFVSLLKNKKYIGSLRYSKNFIYFFIKKYITSSK